MKRTIIMKRLSYEQMLSDDNINWYPVTHSRHSDYAVSFIAFFEPEVGASHSTRDDARGGDE